MTDMESKPRPQNTYIEKIKIKSLTGGIFEVKVDGDMEVIDLLEEIEERVGIPSD